MSNTQNVVRSCRVDLHVVIATCMGYTALYKITASFSKKTKKEKFGVIWVGQQVRRQ